MAARPPEHMYVCHTYRHLYVALVLAYNDHLQGRSAFIVVSFTKNVRDPAVIERVQQIAWVDLVDLTNKALVRRLDRLHAFFKVVLYACFQFAYPRLNPDVERIPNVRNARIFLFNDAHYISRFLIRRNRRAPFLIEDGNMNYMPVKASAKSWVKRLLQLYPSHGWDPRITRILVQNPEGLPAGIRSKGSRLHFHQALERIPDRERKAIIEAFCGGRTFQFGDNAILVLTQPYFHFGRITYERHVEVYGEIVRIVQEHGYQVYLKAHPSDTIEYERILTGIEVLPTAFPIEILNDMCPDPIKYAIGVNTTAIHTIEFAERTVPLLPHDCNIQDDYRANLETIRANLRTLLEWDVGLP